MNTWISITLAVVFLLLFLATFASQLVDRFAGQTLRARYLDREMKILLGEHIWPTFRDKLVPRNQRGSTRAARRKRWWFGITDIPNETFVWLLIDWVRSFQGKQPNTIQGLVGMWKHQIGQMKVLEQDEGESEIIVAERKELAETLARVTQMAGDDVAIEEAISHWFGEFENASVKKFRHWVWLRVSLFIASLAATLIFNVNLLKVTHYLLKNKDQAEAVYASLSKIEGNYFDPGSYTDDAEPHQTWRAYTFRLDSLKAIAAELELPIFYSTTPPVLRDTTFVISFSRDSLGLGEGDIRVNERPRFPLHHQSDAFATVWQDKEPPITYDSLIIGSNGFRLSINAEQFLPAGATFSSVHYELLGLVGEQVNVKGTLTYEPASALIIPSLSGWQVYLGIFLTAGLASLGGPFWFDVWKKLSQSLPRLRSPVKK